MKHYNSSSVKIRGEAVRTWSPRRIEICCALVNGCSTAQMLAEKFNLSADTVKRHMTQCFELAGVKNKVELALWVQRHPEIFKTNETGC